MSLLFMFPGLHPPQRHKLLLPSPVEVSREVTKESLKDGVGGRDSKLTETGVPRLSEGISRTPFRPS